LSKLLSGRDLALYIKERHSRSARILGAKLAILYAGDDPATAKYIAAKERYGQDIGAEVIARKCGSGQELEEAIDELNADETVDGIIVQLPLPWDVQHLLDKIDPTKDVDGLGEKALYDPATPTGIIWLLSGYNIDVKGKRVAVVGQGKLVGKPVARMLEDAGANVVACDIETTDLAVQTKSADIVITATGSPGLITSEMVGPNAVVIDAGTAMKDGKLVGDCDQTLYDRPDIKITPVPGGVGPMTVAALFDHLLRAAQAK
jgi:methylenetetrahydrofolate dehydrogenase (NADP+) / methenyltetrahydrofolate cyclohydrolase